MKNSLIHLPQSKQLELQKITNVILQNCRDVEKIILFGSYARGDYKEAKDLPANRKSGHVSDYDILVVTATKDSALDSLLWQKISHECEKLALSAHARILTHDIEALNIKLAESQYFFTDIKKEGILLFDQGRVELLGPRQLTLKEIQRIAQEHYDYWFNRASGFFRHFQDELEKPVSATQLVEDNGLAAFFLHQAAESAYKAVLLVFSNYNPNEHFLEFLGEESEKYCHLMQNIFSNLTKEEEERFHLLEYAYIGGRYDPNYRISKSDLELLARDVEKLLTLTKKVCEEKIRSLE